METGEPTFGHLFNQNDKWKAYKYKEYSAHKWGIVLYWFFFFISFVNYQRHDKVNTNLRKLFCWGNRTPDTQADDTAHKK